METAKYIISDYLEVLSSKEPTPGGGGVAALAASLGVSLAAMVGSLTVGKEKYKEYEEDVIAIMEKAVKLQKDFLSLADDDAKAFKPLSKAYSMPRKTDEEKAARNEVMQKALVEAAEVPLGLIRTCSSTIPLFEELLTKGSTLAISDVAVGARMVTAAAESALLNVYINTKLFKDKKLGEEINKEAEALIDEIFNKLNPVVVAVMERVKLNG